MRRVFFSFHYEDVWRVMQVRNMWVTVGKEVCGFDDKANFEKIKRESDAAAARWIDEQMHGTSVAVVLIGTKTYDRRFVNYEINRAISDRKGIIGVHINGLVGQDRFVKPLGRNPLDKIKGSIGGRDVLASRYYKTHQGNYLSIQKNISDWIEAAARQVGR